MITVESQYHINIKNKNKIPQPARHLLKSNTKLNTELITYTVCIENDQSVQCDDLCPIVPIQQ